MKVLLGSMTGISFLAVAAMIDVHALLIVAAGLLLVGLAVLLWALYGKWKRRQRAKVLSGRLASHSSSAPAAISDPASRAKLDDLRQNFSRGLEKFHAAGKDLYSLPWYVVCGEPGSGKTEAVRHCNVGFPPGLQDEMQGAGGTINMHWWFTNQAVLIDTAGKLLFQEAPPGSTTEWAEFLRLLRKARPTCPINGLLLVIPSESLIRDSFEDIQRKAGKIARQLDTIQRTLDVRFPVFVLITKCDLINGFREFFSGIKNPQLQHQLTGWSNPAPLDTPFAPETVDQHLAEVVQRISRRRLGLLRDPVSADVGKRRIDEVDALFALPASIEALAPRLRQYLEMIFVAGEWSAKPLFLRGIYFTSALTEGSALDSELATAVGIPVEQLPEGKAWERERSFFLRDLFVQKIFKERGLVTRASNTNKLVRRRQLILGGVVACGLVALVIVSLFARRALQSSIGEELIYWGPAARAENWTDGRWLPIVNGGLDYTGNDVVKLESGVQWPIIKYLDVLQKRVQTDLHINWVFKPIESLAVRANANRRRAQLALFEASVIGPLVAANRDHLINATSWAPADSDRLAALIELEDAIYLKGQPGYNSEYPADDFFGPLLGPSLAQVPNGQAVMGELDRIFEWTYFGGGAGRGTWPGAWLSAGKTLQDNQPLLRGWNLLEKSVQAAQAAQKDAFQTIQEGRVTVDRYLVAEKAFLNAVNQPRSGPEWKEGVLAAWADLEPRRAAMDTLVENLRKKTGVTSGVTLDSAYRAIGGRLRAEAGRASQRIRAVLGKQQAAAAAAARATSGSIVEFMLYRDVQRRLIGLDSQVTTLMDQMLPPSDQTQLGVLDAQALQPVKGGAAAYAVRCDAYRDAIHLVAPAFAPGAPLLGHLAETMSSQASSLTGLRDRVAKYDGSMRMDFGKAMHALLEAAPVLGTAGTVAAYEHEIDTSVFGKLGYPLGSGPALAPDQLAPALTALQRVREDAKATGLPSGVRHDLESRFARADAMAAFAAQLVGPDGSPASARLYLVRASDQANVIDLVGGSGAGPSTQLSWVFPSLRIEGRPYRTRGLPQNEEIAKLSVSAPLPRIEFFTTPDPQPKPDAVLPPSGAWGLIRLLQHGAGRRAAGKEWVTLNRLREGGKDLVLAAVVVFDRPLPPLDRWPTTTP